MFCCWIAFCTTLDTMMSKLLFVRQKGGFILLKDALNQKMQTIFSTIVCWINDGLLMMLLFFPFLFLEKWMCWKAEEKAQCMKPTITCINFRAKNSIFNLETLYLTTLTQCCEMRLFYWFSNTVSRPSSSLRNLDAHDLWMVHTIPNRISICSLSHWCASLHYVDDSI